jgi:hypothetical protein
MIHNNFTPATTQLTEIKQSNDGGGRSATSAAWFGAWGSWLSGGIALAGLLWVLHVAGVF